ncbi:unnamed protein product [Ixodes pacificus]
MCCSIDPIVLYSVGCGYSSADTYYRPCKLTKYALSLLAPSAIAASPLIGQDLDAESNGFQTQSGTSRLILTTDSFRRAPVQIDPMANASSHPDGFVLDVELVNKELWARLAANTHQMEVNDQYSWLSPPLVIRVQGLQPEKLYELFLLFVPMDATICGSDGVWTPLGMPSKQALKISSSVHPGGLMSGHDWMSEVIVFNCILLTTDSAAVQPKVYLELHRRYQPVFQFVHHGNPESLVLTQLRFVTVRHCSSRSQMKLKAEGLANTASYMKEKHTEGITLQRSVEEKPPLRGLQQEQLCRNLPGASSKPPAEKRSEAPKCDTSGLPVIPLSVSRLKEKAPCPDRRRLPITAYQDLCCFDLPSTSSSGITRSYSVPVNVSSGLQNGSSDPHSEPAAQAWPSPRDCYLPCNSKQLVEASKTYQDFPRVACDGSQVAPVPVNIRQLERECHEVYCADLNKNISAELDARRGTQQLSSPHEDDKCWSLLCEVCMDKPTDAVSAVAASKDTDSEEFQYWVDALASNIFCNDTSSTTTIRERMIDILFRSF